jgi:serine protease Do
MNVIEFVCRYSGLRRPLGVAGLLSLGFSGLSGTAFPADIRRDATVEAVERGMPSVVNIATKTRVERRGYFYDWWRDNWAPFTQEMPSQYSAGSGVIIHEGGYVLTNVHVVEQADEVWVNLSDGRIIPAKRLVGFLKTDLALLKLLGKPGEKYTAAKFAADDDLLLGETVLALGNPFGLGGSVSRGILSAKNRRMTSSEGEPLDVQDWLQTDASINPGNSGGPLINLRAEVIGINVAVYQKGQGIGFAIPVKQVSGALAHIFTPVLVEQLWFGARLKAGSPPLKIIEVNPKSPAEKAGLKPGDVIVAINDKTPKNLIEFNGELISAGEEHPVSLVVQRGMERKNLSLRLLSEKTIFNAELIQEKIGVTVQPLTTELAETLGVNLTGGLIIADVEKNSPAAQAGVQRRSIVLGIDGQSIQDIPSAAKLLYAKKKGEEVVLNLAAERTRGVFVRWDRVKAVVTVR